MSIKLTDELHAATVKGKIASAKEVFLDGDKENLQQVGDRTSQLEEAVKSISATGGASTAGAVSYDHSASGMTAVTAQGAIDELAAKNKVQDTAINTKADSSSVQSSLSELKDKNASQDTEIAKKANAVDVTSQMQTEQTRVNTELDKKFDKENVVQELGDAEDKVVSQCALPFRTVENPEWIYLIKDAEDHVLFGIQQDGSIEWGAGIPSPVKNKIQEVIDREASDKEELDTKTDSIKTELSALIDTLNTSFSEEIQNLKDTKVDKEEGKSLIEDEVKEHFEVIENDEWFTLMLDAEGHILFGIKRDTGKPYFPLNEMYHVEQSSEFFVLWKDAEDHILMGIRKDGEIIGEIHAVNALKKAVDDVQKNISSISKNLEALESVINVQNLKSISEAVDFNQVEIFNTKSLNGDSDFLLSDDNSDCIYVGYKKKFHGTTLLKEYEISLYEASELDINDEYEFYLGEIDQRNWFLPRLNFTVKVVSVKDGLLKFSFDNIIAKENEVLIFKAHSTKKAINEGSNKIVSLYNNGNRSAILYYTRNINDALQNVESEILSFPDASVFLSCITYRGMLVDNLSFKELQDKVTTNTNTVSLKQNLKLVDIDTGKKYKIQIRNGALELKSLSYDKILCIGNSFTIGWYNRTLASTSDKTPYYVHIKNVTGATVVDNAGWVTLERSLLDTDFSTLPNKDNDYDAILLQLGENVVSNDRETIYKAFKKAFQTIKNNWKNADVYYMFGRVTGNKSDAICRVLQQAAIDEDVAFTDCSDVSLKGHSLKGDFAYDKATNLVEISNAAYSSHPSDIGCYEIAKKVLELMGYESSIPSRKFSINKIQTVGGTISTADDYWISDGLVTVQCIPNDNFKISSIKVVASSGEIETTKKTNSLDVECFIFTMPATDVTITPTWTNIN